jgi:uncharacterized protein (DUF4415 family)
MRKEYDFSSAKRAGEAPHLARLQAEAKGKTRISIWIDDDVLAVFRARAATEGRGYQTLMNEALKAACAEEAAPLTLKSIRRVIREELRAA